MQALSLRTALCDLLGVRYPVVQDGMGPLSTAALAIAVCNAGGLGTVSTSDLAVPGVAAAQLKAEIQEVAKRVTGPFAVNIPIGSDTEGRLLPASEECVQTVLHSRESIGRPSVLITSGGDPREISERAHAVGLLHVHKVGSVSHARKAVSRGTDAIIASGYEMGGHTHAVPVHTMVLAPQVIDAVDVPVLVSGGIFSGRGIAGALAMGAVGVALGTRFIATEDNDWHPAAKRAIVEATIGSDVIVPGVFGPLRALRTPAVSELTGLVADASLSSDEVTRWKYQRMALAMKSGDLDLGLMPIGQCASGITDVQVVATLMQCLVRDAALCLQRAAGSIIDEQPAASSPSWVQS